jgi:hypothetical protein
LESQKPSLLALLLGLLLLTTATEGIACSRAGMTIGVVVTRTIVVFSFFDGTLQRRKILLKFLNLQILLV